MPSLRDLDEIIHYCKINVHDDAKENVILDDTMKNKQVLTENDLPVFQLLIKKERYFCYGCQKESLFDKTNEEYTLKYVFIDENIKQIIAIPKHILRKFGSKWEIIAWAENDKKIYDLTLLKNEL